MLVIVVTIWPHLLMSTLLGRRPRGWQEQDEDRGVIFSPSPVIPEKYSACLCGQVVIY